MQAVGETGNSRQYLWKHCVYYLSGAYQMLSGVFQFSYRMYISVPVPPALCQEWPWDCWKGQSGPKIYMNTIS